MRNVIIEEQGAGLPDVGECVYDKQNNTIVMVESIDSGILTKQWANNYVHATVSDAGDPTELEDEEFKSLRPVTIRREE